MSNHVPSIALCDHVCLSRHTIFFSPSLGHLATFVFLCLSLFSSVSVFRIFITDHPQTNLFSYGRL